MHSIDLVESNLKIMKKSVSFVLLAVILLQSCVVYQKTPVSLDQAYDKSAAKVVSLKGKEVKYQNIKLENNAYYGIKGNKEVILDTLLISNVYLKDIEKSKQKTILNIGSVGLGIAILVTYLFVLPALVF